jgi:tetratricopeptide (TPR) repeat protein
VVALPIPADAAVARTEELRYDASDDTWAEADLLESLSGLYAYAGRSADARAALDRSQSLIAGLGVKLALAVPNIEAGHIELTLGDPVAAERRLRAGYETLQAVGARYFLALATIVLAEALYDQGRFDADAQMIEEALDGASPNFPARAAFVQAKLLARRGQFTEARSLAEEGARLAPAASPLAQATVHEASAEVNGSLANPGKLPPGCTPPCGSMRTGGRQRWPSGPGPPWPARPPSLATTPRRDQLAGSPRFQSSVTLTTVR